MLFFDQRNIQDELRYRAVSGTICDNALLNNYENQFGEDFTESPEKKETFRATVKVSVNLIFYAWVFLLAGGVRIVEPESIWEEYQK